MHFVGSLLVTGSISAYSTVDAQVTFNVPRAKATIKVGGANLLNYRCLQYAGGPTFLKSTSKLYYPIK